METNNTTQTDRPTLFHRLRLALVIAFTVAGVLTAILTFIFVRDLITSWELTSLPGIALQHGEQPVQPDTTPGVIQDAQTPLQSLGGPTPQPWDGARRISMLVMGLDHRDWAAGEGAPRTDTMVLMTMDPIERTAGVISIPRDLWVNIPGFEYGRINTAYSLGEAYQYPNGGGPGLAMRTVEGVLGIPIDYYAQVDFGAFIRFVDYIGGVKIDIPEKIKVDPLGDNNVKTIKPGAQTLDGELALAYARSRKTEGGDFDRAQRTQQVIMALRKQVMRKDVIKLLLSNAPAIYQDISSGVRTNLSLEQALQLTWLGRQIPEENIKMGVIGPPDQVLLVTSPDGDQVLKPITDKIRLLRDQIVFGTQWTSPVAASMSAIDLLKAEAPKITLLNGSAEAGLASRTMEYLQNQGVTIAQTGNAEQLYSSTTIFDYTGKIYTVKFLVELMQINQNQIFSRYDPTSQVDVAIILGTDWAAVNSMP